MLAWEKPELGKVSNLHLNSGGRENKETDCLLRLYISIRIGCEVLREEEQREDFEKGR